MSRQPHANTRDLGESGRSLRKKVSRTSLAQTPRGARDPLGILAEQNSTRLPELIGLRVERMSLSPFTFYRGTAALMAADLAAAPHTGILVPSCGDAHVSNFGFYASPQRTLVFDLNDFDEAAWAPWEWDLKRLVTSVIIGGRAAGHSESVIARAARRTVRSYRFALDQSLPLTALERYFTHFDAEAGTRELCRASRRVLDKAVAGARKRTGERAVRRLTERGSGGRLRFVERAPTMTPLAPDIEGQIQEYIEQYHRSAPSDIRLLLDGYSLSDTARRVVGVGSVGTRCAVVLFEDGDGRGLILQAKQANRSVLEQYGGITQPKVLTDHVVAHGEGARVVALQRILQAVSDPFLGHLRAPDVELYVRQFHDMKGGIEVSELDEAPFATYAEACAITLARAHSQSVFAPMIVGYIGAGRGFTEAIVTWSMNYADISERDYRAFVAAERSA